MDSVKVLLFGAAADVAGTRQVEISVESATVEEIWPLITSRHPGLESMRDSLAFAVNDEYASPDTLVSEGDELAVLPPVSGG